MRKPLLIAAAAVLTTFGVFPAGAASTDVPQPAPSKVEASEHGSYVVMMTADPVVASEGADLSSSIARAKRQALRESHDRALRGASVAATKKVNDYGYSLNGFSVVATHQEAERLAAQPGVLRVMPDELRQLTTDSSPNFLGLTAPRGPWARGLTGEGVVVGVIDTGIWPEHPSFADDGSYPPLGLTLEDTPANPACDFGNTAHNPDDPPFACNDKLLGARQVMGTYRTVIGADPDEYDSARDDNGHGTHTASTAAGNSDVAASMYGIPLGTISGIAPRARAIAYKACGNLGCFTSDLAAAIDQTVADGVDVINYSIGGGASLLGADDIAFLFAADAGVFAATSAGNSGPGAETVGGPGTVPWITTVGANTQSRFFEGTIRLANRQSYVGASVTPGTTRAHRLVDAEFAGGDLCVPGELDPRKVAGTIVLCRRGAIARTDKSLAVYQAGGAGMIMYNNSDDDNLFSDSHWVPSVHIDQSPGLAIKSYIATTRNPRARITTGTVGEWESAPSMTIFSSRGPNPVAPDIIKPDVTAPGIQILAGNSPTPDPGSVPGELFMAIAGTSMSSPHVAGAFALLKQAHPNWSAAMARSALMTTATPAVVDNDRVSPAGPFAMGAGMIQPGGPVRAGSAYQPGLVYDAGFLEYLGFLCEAAPEAFADPEATCATLAGLGIPTAATDLNLPSIGVFQLAGETTVTRTVTSVASGRNTFRASVEAPPGFDVTVTPSVLRLAKGQTATFEVTFTNNGTAQLDEWAFGSLTWQDGRGRYSVRSSIAVRGVAFFAPLEVLGTGTEGSTSFDVRFGYTGDYNAAAHGLEPATLTEGTVAQDPDQSFDPSDVGNGATLHEFTLSGAAHLRLAIPPENTEADADLDVFVYDPNGELVASSTKGGTDELIDLTLPMDGTWQVYVHGWLTIGPDSDYTLESWVVSATPGGSLSVDAAPTSATLGADGTVEVSWSGLDPATGYLGAVSHTGPDGLLGLTLVSVTTE